MGSARLSSRRCPRPVSSRSLTSFRPAFQAIGDAAVDAVNLGLEAGAFALRLQGHDVRIVDIARMADEISADPGTFGFLSLDQPTLLGNGIRVQPQPQRPAARADRLFRSSPSDHEPARRARRVFGGVADLSHRLPRRGNDFIVGRSGDDLVLAGAGNDQASLGGGNDILFGGLGDDVADGGRAPTSSPGARVTIDFRAALDRTCLPAMRATIRWTAGPATTL